MDLENFVSSQAGEGKHDSTGAFTLSLEQANRKLAQYRFPRQQAWICLIVQAAVGWKCKEIAVTQTDRQTRFRLSRAITGPPPSEEILGSLDLELDGHSPLSRFCLALHALLNQKAEEPLSLVDDEHNHLLLTLSHPKPKRFGWLPIGVRREQIDVVGELERFATYSPVPIIVDGRRIVASPQNLMSFVGRLPRPGLPTLTLPHFLADLGEVGALLEIRCGENLERNPAKRCSLRWIQHGVVVEEQTIDLETQALEAFIVLNGDNLKTDLTGFRLIEDADKRKRLVCSILDLIPALRKARKSLKLKGLEAEHASYRRPGPLEELGDGYFVVVPAPLLATGGLLVILSPLLAFSTGLGLAAGLGAATVGAGFIKAGMWSTTDNITKRRLASQEEIQAKYSLLLQELSQLEQLLQARVAPGKV